MKNKISIALVALVIALGCCAFGLAACNDGPEAVELLVAKSGEQPNGNELSINITYGEKPDLDYKLYVSYKSGDTEEIAFDDENLTVVAYGYSESGGSIEKLPDEYLYGTYTIEYEYRAGKSGYRANVFINVARAASDEFTVLPEATSWCVGENSPNVVLKNPKGLAVQYREGFDELLPNDTNGTYSLYIIKKDAYLAFTDAQKMDYDYINDYFSADGKTETNIWLYSPDFEEYLPAGEYMLVAVVESTHNYCKSVTPARSVTIREPIVGRPFTFQSLVVQDKEGNVITEAVDDDTETLLGMAEHINENNEGKTIIFNASGEVRGTVNFTGDGAFDKMVGDKVYTYALNGTGLIIYNNNKEFGTVKKTGNTVIWELPFDENYYFIITFTV